MLKSLKGLYKERLAKCDDHRKYTVSKFEEEKHPRGKGGKFTSGEGQGGKEDKPESGKTYQLTGAPGEATIHSGASWKESEKSPDVLKPKEENTPYSREREEPPELNTLSHSDFVEQYNEAIASNEKLPGGKEEIKRRGLKTGKDGYIIGRGTGRKK